MRIRFAEFVFDSDLRVLERSGAPVHLTPKAFDLLGVLVDQRPKAISKREILDRVWSDVVVAEENVKSLVAEIRRALGEHAYAIRTVRCHGYAFRAAASDASAVEPLAWLYYEARALPLSEATCLGRDPRCEVCIDAPGVSRRHARITIDGSGALLEDLGSKNGTHLGRTRVREPVALRDGDRIRLGSVKLIYRTRSAGGATITEDSQDR